MLSNIERGMQRELFNISIHIKLHSTRRSHHINKQIPKPEKINLFLWKSETLKKSDSMHIVRVNVFNLSSIVLSDGQTQCAQRDTHFTILNANPINAILAIESSILQIDAHDETKRIDLPKNHCNNHRLQKQQYFFFWRNSTIIPTLRYFQLTRKESRWLWIQQITFKMLIYFSTIK